MTVQKGKKQEPFHHSDYCKYAEMTSAGYDWPHTHLSESREKVQLIQIQKWNRRNHLDC